jgi:hypothetical protein
MLRPRMNLMNFHVLIAFLSLALLFFIVVIFLHFAILPLFFLALGFFSYLWSGRKALMLFLFWLPLVNSTPGLFFNGYPFNYMGIALFYLSGILIASSVKKENPKLAFPGYRSYLLLLTLIAMSAFFVFLRWSNLGLPGLAFLRDTPVAPGGERLSFACIFPVITLALFTLSPFLVFLIRHWHLSEREIFDSLKAGFCFSFLLALVQKWIAPGFMAQSWWGLKMNQLNGGFSDFNAFGFFAGTMFLYQALKMTEKIPRDKEVSAAKEPAAGSGAGHLFSGKNVLAETLFIAVTLAAIFFSGCRTAFLFVLLAVLHLVFAKKIGLAIKAMAVLLMFVALVFAGGTLKKRLQQTTFQTVRLTNGAGLYRVAEEVGSGRMAMLKDGVTMIARFPFSGVGSGNFLFYLKFLRFRKSVYLDLPLNQYLLFFSENGLFGGLAFVFFLAALFWRQKPGSERFVLGAMAFALLFNNFFWFPECLLLFWIFVARMEWSAPTPAKKAYAWGVAVVIPFMAMNAVNFKPLQPLTWARKTSTAYDYGFSYPETDRGRRFRWSGEKAGMYIDLDKNGQSAEYKLVCGAPLSALPGRSQVVEIYWRKKLFKRLIFQRNGKKILRIEDKDHRRGFLEFRVCPTFNLQRLGLGRETRDLGIQVSGPGK